MSNRLKMSKSQFIIALRDRGWSLTRIAQELGVHRHTVARYVDQHAKSTQTPDPDGPKSTQLHSGSDDPKSTEAPTGSVDSKSTQVHTGSAPTSISRSACEPLRQAIEQKLDDGLSAQRIYQDLVAEQGFEGSYWSVMRFVRHLGVTRELPFRRIECAPGDEAQVDFGSGAPVITPEGRRRGTHVFRIVLSHSRKAYSEAVFRQDTETFLRCLENAFWHFRGVPKTLVIDNLRAAVQKADWYEPELHPKLRSFCAHYSTVILPTRPYMPRHKGKVESGVKYVKNNALKARVFATIEQENDFLQPGKQRLRIPGFTARPSNRWPKCSRRSNVVRYTHFPWSVFRASRKPSVVCTAMDTLKWITRTTRCHRSIFAGPSGHVGTTGWFEYSMTALSRLRFMSRSRRVADSARIAPTSRRRRSAAWSAARRGCSNVSVASVRMPILGLKR